MGIGLALSGGGVRATVFHLGVLARLAETALWDQLAHISTVSGGSLCISLVTAKAGGKWPTADEYLRVCLPQIKEVLTTFDLQRAYFWHTVTHPWLLLEGRAHVVAKLIEKYWGVTGDVADMPREPRWTINATCYETGKNWRFAAKRMGDYAANYVIEPKFPLADAVAASAAFPGLIGPLVMRTGKYQWHKYDEADNLVPTEPIAKSLVLWDGGVYDNLGLEALYKAGKGFREGIDFCLVSDASGAFATEERGDSESSWVMKMGRAGNRLIAIPVDQVRSLRAREMFSFFRANRCGGYLRMGESVQTICQNLEFSSPHEVQASALTPEQVRTAAMFSTCLSMLETQDYHLLFQHGYETCNAVLGCHLNAHEER